MAQRRSKGKGKGTQRTRSVRRELERANVKLAEQRKKLFLLLPGGTPERPIEVPSAALVEARASSTDCPHCGEGLRVKDHVAENRQGVRLRRVDAGCPHCGQVRALWFRIVGDSLN